MQSSFTAALPVGLFDLFSSVPPIHKFILLVAVVVVVSCFVSAFCCFQVCQKAVAIKELMWPASMSRMDIFLTPPNALATTRRFTWQ